LVSRSGAARGTKLVVTLEEGVVTGGFGAAVLEALAEAALADESLRGLPVRLIGLPRDHFVDHGAVGTCAATCASTPGITAGSRRGRLASPHRRGAARDRRRRGRALPEPHRCAPRPAGRAARRARHCHRQNRPRGSCFRRGPRGEGDGEADRKPGETVAPDVPLALVARPRFVSRGGEKLDAALTAFEIDVRGRVCLDVGASTGGFTDVLLRRGATRVYALDVGHGQLADALRSDPRVVSMERTHAARLDPSTPDHVALPEPVSLAVIDVSFIS
jgi:hypothetical protein